MVTLIAFLASAFVVTRCVHYLDRDVPLPGSKALRLSPVMTGSFYSLTCLYTTIGVGIYECTGFVALVPACALVLPLAYGIVRLEGKLGRKSP